MALDNTCARTKNYKTLKTAKIIKIGNGSVMKGIVVGNVHVRAFNGCIFQDKVWYDVPTLCSGLRRKFIFSMPYF